MAEYKTKPEIAPQKRWIKLSPAIGDWTTYKPPKILTKKIKTGLYGFDRLSEEELSQALLLHYRFGQELVAQLKIDLHLGAELFSVQAEQTTYLNFLRTIGSPVVPGKIKISPFPEAVALVIDLHLASSLINYALGSRDLEPLNRSLTEAENNVLQTTLEEYLPRFSAVFENIFAVPQISLLPSLDVLPDPELIPTSTFICFQLEISLAENPPGRFIFGYLGYNLKNLVQKYLVQQQTKSLDFSLLPLSLLNRIRIPVKVSLGNTYLLTSELENLENGDVVSLDTTIQSALLSRLGKNLNLQVQPGIKNKKYVVRIASLEPEETVRVPPPQPIFPPEESMFKEKIEEEATKEEEFPKETSESKEEFAEEEAGEEEFPEEDIFLEEEEEFKEEEE